MASETIHVSDSIFIEIRDSEGKINGQHNSKQEHPKLFVNEPTTIKARYRFDDGEDVFASCEMYLNELETIVMDGKSKGFLT